MAQYELTNVLVKYLDRHLVFPLLEFLQEKGIYREEDIMRSKLALLQKTNLVDFAVDIYKLINNTEEVPSEMMSRRNEVVTRLRKLQVSAQFCISSSGCRSSPIRLQRVHFRLNVVLSAHTSVGETCSCTVGWGSCCGRQPRWPRSNQGTARSEGWTLPILCIH